MLVGAVAVLAAGCGGGGATAASAGHHTTSQRPAAADRRRAVPAAPARLVYRPLYALPAPLRDPATAPLPQGRFALLGGLSAADVSTDEVDVADRHGLVHTTTLPEAQHDAQAATLGGSVYVFGGGSATELDHILRYDPAGQAVTQVGALSVAQSDVAVTEAGGSAYVVGGFDGTNYLHTIVRWRPGTSPRVVGHLPVGLRYAAVAVAGDGLFVLGGSTPAAASDAIYRFDLTTHRVRRMGTLRHPITHGMAATLGSTVYLIGGRGDSLTSQTRDIWAINPTTGAVTPAGRLPVATSDAGVTTTGGTIVFAGGQTPSSTLAGVGELVPSPVR